MGAVELGTKHAVPAAEAAGVDHLSSVDGRSPARVVFSDFVEEQKSPAVVDSGFADVLERRRIDQLTSFVDGLDTISAHHYGLDDIGHIMDESTTSSKSWTDIARIYDLITDISMSRLVAIA